MQSQGGFGRRATEPSTLGAHGPGAPEGGRGSRCGLGSRGRDGEGLAADAGQEAPRAAPDRPGTSSRMKHGTHEAGTEEAQRP